MCMVTLLVPLPILTNGRKVILTEFVPTSRAALPYTLDRGKLSNPILSFFTHIDYHK